MEILTSESFTTKKVKGSRHRLTKACESCRARKIKCDGMRPKCTSCSTKCLDQCIYSQSLADGNMKHDDLMNLRLENASLRKQLAALKLKQTTTGCLPQGSKTLNKKLFHCVNHKKSRSVFYGTTSYRNDMALHFQFYKKFLTESRKNIDADRKEWVKSQNAFLSIISIPDGTVDPNALLRHLESFLPSLDTLRIILNEYFDGVFFKLFPFIDRQVFMDDFERIFANKSDSIPKLEISYKVSDFARIALVLAVIKMTLTFQYGGIEAIDISIFTDSNDALLKYIDRFLECARYLTRTSFPTLQTIFMLRCIKKVDMLDGDGGDTSNGAIYFGLAFEMALILGLDKDVSIIYKNETPEFLDTARRIWRCLLFFDSLNSFDLGMAPHISDQYLNLELVNDNSLMTDCTLMFRKVSQNVNCPNCDTLTVVEELRDLKSFYRTRFQPIYSIIDQLKRSHKLQIHLFREALLCIQTIGIISSLYSILTRADITGPFADKNYIMTAKTCLLGAIVTVDLVSTVSKFNSVLISDYARNQYSVIAQSLSMQTFVRGALHPVTQLVAELDDSTTASYKPYSSFSMSPTSESRNFSINTSDWACLEYHQETDPYIFSDVKSLNDIAIHQFHRAIAIKKRENSQIRKIADRVFLFKYCWTKFAEKVFVIDGDLKAKAESFRKNITVNYEPYMESTPLDKLEELGIEQELESIARIAASNEEVNKVFFTFDDEFILQFLNEPTSLRGSLW